MVSALAEGVAGVAPVDRAKRLQVLDGARRVFLARGFEAASMGEIARAAGVSKGTLYVYFDSKETLFEALTLAERSSLAEALFDLDEHDPDTRAVLRQLGLSYLDMMIRPEHVAAVRMVIGTVDRFPRFGRMFFESGPEVGVRRLGVYLDRQVEAGRLVIRDTALAAEHFLNLCASDLFKRLLFGVAGAPPTLEQRRSTIEAALHVFFAAYGAATPPA